MSTKGIAHLVCPATRAMCFFLNTEGGTYTGRQRWQSYMSSWDIFGLTACSREVIILFECAGKTTAQSRHRSEKPPNFMAFVHEHGNLVRRSFNTWFHRWILLTSSKTSTISSTGWSRNWSFTFADYGCCFSVSLVSCFCCNVRVWCTWLCLWVFWAVSSSLGWKWPFFQR